MDSTKSKQLLRYHQNQERYNTRAKIYYNNVYYPLHRDELLKKGREYRAKKKNLVMQTHAIYNNCDQNIKKSVVVSFN